ncbi:MAG: GIY-YIG nuclease family protein [Aestuariivirga sp.]
MYYVYILRSETSLDRYYIGFTEDLKKRLGQHNAGESIHTNKYLPWRLKTYTAFDSKKKAQQFEACLKSGYGRSFVKKHL